MPELPEMETYKKLLNENLAGKVITEIEVNRAKSINIATDDFTKVLLQNELIKVDRRAKYLIFHLSGGKYLLLHLMLGGWMYLGDEGDSPARTKQVILTFSDRKLYFIGLRLGFLHLVSEEELQSKLADLGPEPLDLQFDYAAFQKIVEGKRSMLKTALIDQQFIAGIGNCYSDEICYAARLMPSRKFGELQEEERNKVYEAIKETLKRGIRFGGYMEDAFYKDDGLTGGYNDHCFVYDREGEPCTACGTKIVKTEISSRKSFYCPGCQH